MRSLPIVLSGNVWLQALIVALPWLCAWSIGPIVISTQWLLAGAAMSYVLYFGVKSLGLVLALRIASLLSAGVACLQYFSPQRIPVGPWIAIPSGSDIYANLFQRNHLASLCALGLMAWLALPLPQKSQPRRFSVARTLVTFAVVWFIAMVNAMTSSRVGAINWILATVLSTHWSFWARRGAVAATAILAYGASLALLPELEAMLSHPSLSLATRLTDSSSYTRVALWSNVLELIAQRPWLGHGWRSLAYAHYSTDFSGTRFMEMLDNAHNLPLHLAVELGVPVALAFCFFVVWIVRRLRPWAEERWDRRLAWGILLVVGVHSLVEYPLWYGPFFMTALLAVAILSQDAKSRWLDGRTYAVRHALTTGRKVIAVLLCVGVVFAAWDYHRVSQIYLVPYERSIRYADDPLGAARKSVLFQSHAQFAELQITPLSRETAKRVFELSSKLVRWSPEPRIIEKLIESAVMLGRDDVAAFHIKRYRTAYPAAYAAWSKQERLTSAP